MFKKPQEIKQEVDMMDKFLLDCVENFNKGLKSTKDGKVQVVFGIAFDDKSLPGCMKTLTETMKESGWKLVIEQSAFETWPTRWIFTATEL